MLLFTDGCDNYSSTADLAATKKWDTFIYSSSGSGSGNGWQYAAGAGRFGGGALYLDSRSGTTSGAYMGKAVSTASGNTMGVHFSMKCSGVPQGTANPYNAPLIFMDGSSYSGSMVVLCGTGNNTSGQNPGCLAITNGGATIEVGSSINVCDGNWHTVELTATYAGGSGTNVYVRVDSVVVASWLAQNDGRSPGTFGIGSPAMSGYQLWLDDIIFWDNQGGVYNTFPIGQKRISTLYPSGTGSGAQWTSSSGANWLAVGGNYANANNVSDGTSGQFDLYTFSGLPYTPATVDMIVANYYAAQTASGGTTTLIPLVVSATATGSGTPVALGSLTALTIQQPSYVNPNTSGAWTPSGVNAVQVGQKVQ